MANDTPVPKEPGRAQLALVFYGLMALIAKAVSVGAGQESLFLLRPAGLNVAIQAGVGLALGLPVVGFSRLASQRFEWARRLNGELRSMLGHLSSMDILVLAGTSALAEEMLFRGALQPLLGLTLTSVLFGLAHLPPRRDLWPWTLWAVIVGGLLGLSQEFTGTLLAPILAHFTINFFNLHALADSGEPG